MTASPYVRFVKPLLDRVLAGVALVALSPVLAGVALAVAVKLGRPVLFRQARAGQGGRPFEIVKFRSMTSARGADGALLPDAERLPPFGRWLRSTSLDELPELWNVLRGEMSLVGPRPLFLAYVDRYTPEQARRLEARPGLTGWAQVSGRNTLSWEDKFALDVWYVGNASFWLDLRILVRTVIMVLRRDGITADGHATVPLFLGSSQDRNL